MKGKRERERAGSPSRSATNGSWFTPIVIYIYTYIYIHISIIYSSQNNPGMVHLATRNECMRDRVKSIHHIVVRTIKAV